MTPEVARWATQLSISGNMIKWKTPQFYVNNKKTPKYLLQINQNNWGSQEMIWETQFSTMGGLVGDP